jgi:hypothetical protein
MRNGFPKAGNTVIDGDDERAGACRIRSTFVHGASPSLDQAMIARKEVQCKKPP